MDIPNEIKRFIQHTKKKIKLHYHKDKKIIFQKIKIPQGNLYLIYNNEITLIHNQISAYNLKPLGIIAELKNKDYLYYNFQNDYTYTSEIVKKFTQECL